MVSKLGNFMLLYGFICFYLLDKLLGLVMGFLVCFVYKNFV